MSKTDSIVAGEQPHEFSSALTRVFAAKLEGFDRLLSVERLSGGASQETYRLKVTTQAGPRQFAMRRAVGGGVFGPEPIERPETYPGLAAEAALMRAAHAARVPEPEVLHVLRREDELGEGFIMQWLDGEALGARIARAPEFADLREHLAYDCGRVLARIHAIDLDANGLRDLLTPISAQEFVEQTWARYKDYDTPQPMIDYSARWLLENLPASDRHVLVHNDFRNGNIMVNADELVAVLDWEIAHIGDPMRDLGWICTNSWRFGVGDKAVGGFGSRADLFRGYEAESGLRVDPEQVKFWEVFGSFWWAVGSLGMAQQYRNGPDRTVERPGIGRRSSECQVDCVNLLIPGPASLLVPDLVPNSPAIDTLVGARDFRMPRSDELLFSVRDFLRDDVMATTQGRTQFLARVAANSLDIVERELRVGHALHDLELAHLRALHLPTTDTTADLSALRWALVNGLRDGKISLADEVLQRYLRETVVNEVAIDQPKYSGLAQALANNPDTA